MTSRSSQVTGTSSRRAVLGVRAMPSARLSWPVACADYAVAEPDLWEAFAATVTEHLDTDHGDLFAHLARLHLPGRQVVAVAIAELRREVLTLDVVTPDGATRIPLHLNAHVRDPHDLCGRLLEIAAPPAAGGGRGEPR